MSVVVPQILDLYGTDSNPEPNKKLAGVITPNTRCCMAWRTPNSLALRK